jgi:hypothetical protein
LIILRFFLGITFFLGFLAVIDQRQYADEIAVWTVSPNWRFAISIGWILVGIIGFSLGSTWTSVRKIWLRFIEFNMSLTSRMGILRPILVLALAFVFPIFLLGPYGRFILPFFTRLLIFWILVCLGTWFLKSFRPSGSAITTSVAVALIYGVVHRIGLFSADISAYPFSLGWSEASRYYYASLFFSKRIFGVSIPPSVLHPTRYILQSLPYLIPGTGLFTHRLWQVLLWIMIPTSVGIVLAWRLRLESTGMRLLFIAWVFLFLFQGPVWYHLSVMAILILLGTRTERPWWTLGVVLLASLWAGMSRVNWIPVPGLLAALLYFIERKKFDQSLPRYYLWPVTWFLGGIGAGFVSQLFYILVSGTEAGQFGSSLESPLLWYRLLPSDTYPLGVLPGIVMASLPLFLLIGYLWRGRLSRNEGFRLIGVGAILSVLFGGGILVSVKIGGGSNLHNLDAFLVALMVLGVHVAMGLWRSRESVVRETGYPSSLVILAIWMPIFFTIGMGKPLRRFDMDRAQQSLVKIQSIVNPVTSQGGEVLFVSQRHLLPFDVIKDVELVPEYETVFLMEMAMSRNRKYLDQFHHDLETHLYDLIVVDTLATQIQSRDHNFAEENNAWVEEVSYPILCHYMVIETLREPPLQFFVPSDGQESCSL